MSKADEDGYIMPFGKHKDERIGDVPAGYLLWLDDQPWSDKFENIKAYIKRNRAWLDKENNK